MPYPADSAKLAQWIAAMNSSYTANPALWNQYDAAFMAVAQTYNQFLSTTPGFVDLDWQMVKALSWVETGPNAPEWQTRVLQIGNTGDPGLNQLLNTATGQLMLPPDYKASLTEAGVRTIPEQNIRAGIGYLLWACAHFGYVAGSGSQAHQVLSVTSWRAITLDLIASHYNGGGDGNYLGKLTHTYAVAQHGI